MLRCFEWNIHVDYSSPTRIVGYNLSVILNLQNSSAELSKKHVAIYVHTVREAVAADIIESYWLKEKHNTSDITTKQIPHSDFREHVDFICWPPYFHLGEEMRLDDSYIQE